MMKDRLEKTRIKYGEWRPIGVCDRAEPGKMKANTFSKKDFLKVSSANVNRNNWKENPEVMKVVLQYARKLAKRSTLTQTFKRPEVDQIKLVGSVMHISKTPILNRESRDGKVQFFQVDFKEGDRRAKPKQKRPLPWIGILILLLSLILIGMIYTLINRAEKVKFHSPGLFNSSFQQTGFCSGNRLFESYLLDLDEARGILAENLEINIPSLETGLTPCRLLSGSLPSRERQFFRCHQFWEQKNLPLLPFAENKKIATCIRRINEIP